MYFNKFDICEAYFLYYMLWHSGGLTERYHKTGRSIASQLDRIQFKPSPMLSDENDLTDNGREIYEQLVEKYEK